MSRYGIVIEDANLSYAWGRAFVETLKPGSPEIETLIVSVTGFVNGVPQEEQRLRDEIDATLLANNRASCETVARTIFPLPLWQPQSGRQRLYDRYLGMLDHLKAADRHNQYGLYFERLIAFGRERFNQLEHIITTYNSGNHRRTALQASVFDPLQDHTHQHRRGFPCLQHIALDPVGNELHLSGYYATQYLFERAYGNYLGLCWLGRFMAHELQLELTRVTCIASVAKRDVAKSEVADLAAMLDNTLGSTSA